MPETAEATTASRMTGARLADLLEEEIVIGVRFPRERLVEDELMARFDAKRHAVRQALQVLESRGVVERRPNAGAFVRSFTAKEVRDLYVLRDLLEVRAAELIEFPVDPARLEDLAEAQRRHDAAVEANDPRAVVTANMEFHRKLFALSDNEALMEAINRYARVAHAIRSVTVTSTESLRLSRHEHGRMLDALREGDRDLLASTCRAHLIPSRDAYLERVSLTGA
ncbi:GntR family transcriptional regulator [Streptomonospora nanhaiensis]|uniref:GntR family transcriptional regulator n=1 Tax=Streptomonospora nanhaiensis TaxID=1323731 RepID=A0ABY6YGJ6_9ACTN|nr:GntR family transcriptional regulator [Streptomonospora nanhaiensis]WAE71367.1 GntR family transcriptional regulator [Streptomonospora nanhaiensis]